jgi:hypothetical protein
VVIVGHLRAFTVMEDIKDMLIIIVLVILKREKMYAKAEG